MNELSEENIEFSLLHEEGHFKYPKKMVDKFYILIPFLPLVLFVLFLLVTLIFPVYLIVRLMYFLNSVIFGMMAMFILLYGIHVRFIRVNQKYEYLADEFAANYFPNPSGRLESTLNQLPELKINKWFKYFLITLGFEYAHPTHEQRIENIKEKFQTK